MSENVTGSDRITSRRSLLRRWRQIIHAPVSEQIFEEWSQSVNEDCGRCGASIEWMDTYGCPLDGRTIWCLKGQL